MPLSVRDNTEGEAKVVVNNMNCRQPNSDIPSRIRQPRRWMSDLVEEEENLRRRRMEDDESPDEVRAKPRFSVGFMDLEHDQLHPNLEEVYSRMMRRLQRHQNYDDVARDPLGAQYGLCGTDDEEAASEEVSPEPPQPNRFTSLSTASTASKPIALDVQAQKHMVKSAVGKASSVVRFRSSSFADGDDDRALEAEEQALSQQPCPMPLRMVIQHVQETLHNKLSIAERGSLKDCLRFCFESRALLDRLLKEIPSYAHYQHDDFEELPECTRPRSGVSHVQLQHLYQEFRQQPVVLPKGIYVQERDTGAVRSELDMSPVDAVQQQYQLTFNAGPTLPALGQAAARYEQPAPPAINSRFNTTIGEQNKPEVRLPPSYGRSARVHGAGTSMNNVSVNNNSMAVSSLMQHTDGSGSMFCMNDGRVSTPLADSKHSMDMSSMVPVTPTSMGRSSKKSRRVREFELRSVRERKATQVTSVGTLTEENNANMVTRDVFDEMKRYAKGLEVQLAEASVQRTKLVEKANEEANYNSTRVRIVQYLRETLFRECSALRSQLNFAGQKEQQLHAALQQQQPAHNQSARRSSWNSLNNAPPLGRTISVRRRPGASGAPPPSPQPPIPAPPPTARSTNLERESSDSTPAESVTLEYTPANVRSIPQSSNSLPDGGNHMQQPLMSHDINSIESFLDLVLLAVENNETLPCSAEEARRMNPDVLKETLQKDYRSRYEQLRNDFEAKQRELKNNFMAVKVQNSYVVAAKNREIERLTKLCDLSYVENCLREKIQDLRMELGRLRSSVITELNDMGRQMSSTMNTVLARATAVEQTIGDNDALRTTNDALKDLIHSAATLFLPMLTKEYIRGYHPLSVRMRNSVDPLAHLTQTRFGTAEVSKIREQLNVFSELYISLHKFCIAQLIIPDVSRPSTGEPLRRLCSAMALSPMSTQDVLYEIRNLYDVERKLTKKIAKINIKLMWNMYLQRVFTERAVSAVIEAEMNPHTTTLPVSNRINELASQRAILVRERSDLLRQRLDTAKDLYRLWKEKQIDIFEGYPPPVQLNRLTVLSEAQAAGVDGSMPAAQSGAVSMRRSRSSAALFMGDAVPRKSVA